MQINRKALVATTLAAPPLLMLTVAPAPAGAHGTMNNPPSRTMVCYTEGPESPKSAACKKAVELGGTQPLYDWNEVNIANAAGRHRDLIPDGKLCSAGRDKYRGFDQARADWPSTSLSSGASHTFTYRATAPHKGGFDLYVTKDGYDPTRPLKWSDLESKPFLSQQNPTLSNGSYVLSGRLPAKQGRHLIYAIWQRSDSPEAFYSCSDVTFGGSNPNPAPTVTGTPTATPKPTPTPNPGNPPGGGAPGPAPVLNAGLGLGSTTAKVGAQVKVTAVCGGSRVRSVVSNAFSPRQTVPQNPAETWSGNLSATRAGTFPVTAACANGSVARTTLTVTG
ncbi:lytic polysaccharide monooxygenase auxiliary activity family 9 protein [Nonomuraea lactucae]|uniref:lytic polysaccharide monooxygenase auxiliary activity family 9 protein n=1 Tax=Nonomuraea lactucae TaxID=2249762 RepID=UPI000DE3122D|nr:lytic polysaccharide monooxygenase [Nonomuraea lactucae]